MPYYEIHDVLHDYHRTMGALGLSEEASEAVGRARSRNPDLCASNLVDRVFQISFSKPEDLQGLRSQLIEAGLPE